MIRRAFWLSVGAAAGIAGYRRASAVGRAVQVRVAGVTGETRAGTAPAGAAPPPASRRQAQDRIAVPILQMVNHWR